MATEAASYLNLKKAREVHSDSACLSKSFQRHSLHSKKTHKLKTTHITGWLLFSNFSRADSAAFRGRRLHYKLTLWCSRRGEPLLLRKRSAISFAYLVRRRLAIYAPAIPTNDPAPITLIIPSLIPVCGSSVTGGVVVSHWLMSVV